MLKVEDYAQIRRSHRDGMSIRAIARQYGRSRHKIREVLKHSEPQPYTRTKPPVAPKLGPFMSLIDEMLTVDESAPRKQRHTAAQIFRRLRDEHQYPFGYDQVRRYVAKQKRDTRETFLPLDFAPGQRMEADFGHIHVDFPEGRRLVAVLLLTWAHSNRTFAIALPTERVESILHGTVTAFDFFGCVPQELWWDNPTTVATTILTGRERKLHPRYQALASHYNFEPLFCMPARGNEKPHVENRVKNLQRRWATPVPQMPDMDTLNRFLRTCCEKDLSRTIAGQTDSIGERFEQERQGSVALADRPFDACVKEERKVDKYQTVAFDNNRYSVPRNCAFQAATIKAYVDCIVVVVAGQVVAEHQRSYASGEYILHPQHFLTVLGRKPAYLDHTAVFKNWHLPALFDELRNHLEQSEGAHRGAREFIRVLQLLAKHPLERVSQAVESSRRAGWRVDQILSRTEQLAQASFTDVATGAGAATLEVRLEGGALPQVRVPAPNLVCFDQFLSPGGCHHVQDGQSLNAAKDQSQATALAHDVGRI